MAVYYLNPRASYRRLGRRLKCCDKHAKRLVTLGAARVAEILEAA